ncbi:MAG: uroporphyrinogen decarboxylase family protein [Clostridia bacterium]|nr:uroporphyrinogen decarboxylase family protein [Clostridia bacterium]
MNMKLWLEEIKGQKQKSAFPILSFPSVSLLGVSVKEITTDGELQAKGMKMIADRHSTLASVSMMDLSVEAEAFGSTVRFSDDEVPTVVGAVVTCPEDAEELAVPPISAGRCPNYLQAIAKAKELITDRPVFAGVIGPFSLAGRLMDVSEAMVNCYVEPDMVHAVLEKVTQFLINYISEYKKIGANGVVMAEPLAGMLSPALSEEFSAPYVKKIVDAVQDDEFIVIYHNCGDNILLMTDSIVSTGAAAYHFGNSVKMADMLEKMPKDVVVMGNLDPAGQIRNGSVESVKNATKEIMSSCCSYENFVISSGCDIPPESPWANIDAFFEAVKEFYDKK